MPAILSGRQQTCGQLKVTITSPGAQGTAVGRPQPSNTTNYLDSCSSTTAVSPSAGRRLRADISSVAAPKHAAHQGDAFMGTAAYHSDPLMGTAAYQRDRSLGQSGSSAEPEQGRAAQQAQSAGTKCDSADAGSNAETQADLNTDAPGMPAPVDKDSGDPKLQLRTQTQQLSELSHLMSQHMTLTDCHNPDMGPEAARDRADAVHSPKAANINPSSVAVIEAGATCASQGVHTAQRAQHDPEEPHGDPNFGGEALLSAEPAQEAATAYDPSTGNAFT